jgi:hypothetical protein
MHENLASPANVARQARRRPPTVIFNRVTSLVRRARDSDLWHMSAEAAPVIRPSKRRRGARADLRARVVVAAAQLARR